MWGMVGVLLKIKMQILGDHGLEASGNDLRGGLVPKLPNTAVKRHCTDWYEI